MNTLRYLSTSIYCSVLLILLLSSCDDASVVNDFDIKENEEVYEVVDGELSLKDIFFLVDDKLVYAHDYKFVLSKDNNETTIMIYSPGNITIGDWSHYEQTINNVTAVVDNNILELEYYSEKESLKKSGLFRKLIITVPVNTSTEKREVSFELRSFKYDGSMAVIHVVIQ